MSFSQPEELEKSMNNNNANSLMKRRTCAEQEFRANFQELIDDIEAVPNQDVEGDKMETDTSSKDRMRTYLDELAGLIREKEDVENKIVDRLEELMSAREDFRLELGVVLKGRDEDLQDALIKIEGSDAEGEDAVMETGRVAGGDRKGEQVIR